MKKLVFAFAIFVTVAGCAHRPESISASYVSHEKYVQNDCAQLATNMVDARANLAKYSDMQDSKANIDAASVFFLLIPFSALSGDHAGDVAKYKGEVEAIETAQVKNKCKQKAQFSNAYRSNPGWFLQSCKDAETSPSDLPPLKPATLCSIL